MIKVLRFLAICTITIAFATFSIASAQVYTSIDKPQVLSNAVAKKPIHFDVSRPIAELMTEAPAQQGLRLIHAPLLPKLQKLRGAQQRQGAGTAPALQPLIGPPSVPLSA